MAQNSELPIYSGASQLVNVEENLENYNSFIVDKIVSWLPKSPKPTTVVDFGAGSGSLSKLFKSKTGISPTCVEIDPDLIKILTRSGFNQVSDLKNSYNSFGFAYSSNVLEHIENDETIIAEIYNALTPGSIFAIYVPAFQMLYSKMDESVGHVRRYSKSELVERATRAGFKVLNVEFVDSIGFLASLLVRLIGYNSTDAKGSSWALRIYDKIIFPISRLLDRIGFRWILGKNLFLVAQKDVNS